MTTNFHRSALAELINRIRDIPNQSTTKIMVGGFPFLQQPQLDQKFGADGFGKDALEAINVAYQLAGV
jgi:methanogenic corrinoid protein MtbC1